MYKVYVRNPGMPRDPQGEYPSRGAAFIKFLQLVNQAHIGRSIFLYEDEKLIAACNTMSIAEALAGTVLN